MLLKILNLVGVSTLLIAVSYMKDTPLAKFTASFKNLMILSALPLLRDKSDSRRPPNSVSLEERKREVPSKN
jgi:hypothetical protein